MLYLLRGLIFALIKFRDFFFGFSRKLIHVRYLVIYLNCIYFIVIYYLLFIFIYYLLLYIYIYLITVIYYTIYFLIDILKTYRLLIQKNLILFMRSVHFKEINVPFNDKRMKKFKQKH